MDFDLTEEQALFQDTVTAFLADRYSLESRSRFLDHQIGYDTSNWAGLAELGVLALPFATDLGGLGGATRDIAIIQEQIGYHLAVEPFADNVAIPAVALEWFDDRELARSLANGLMAGSSAIAVALGEERHKSQPEREQCRAQIEADRVTLFGSRKLVAYPSADRTLVMADVEVASGDFSPVLLMVQSGTPGVAINHYRLLDGTPAADLEFENAELRVDAVVVGAQQAGDAIEAMRRMGVLAAVAECLGIMRRMFELTTEYMNSRVQFGKALTANQVVRHRLAEMLMHYELAQSVVAGLGLYRAGTEQALRQLSAAKVTLGDAFEYIGKQSIQLHGGIGLTDEYELSHLYKRALVLQDSYGSKRTHSLKLARLEAP